MHERVECRATGRIRHGLAVVMVVTLAAQTHGQKLARLPPVTSTRTVCTTGAEDLRQRIQQLEGNFITFSFTNKLTDQVFQLLLPSC